MKKHLTQGFLNLILLLLFSQAYGETINKGETISHEGYYTYNSKEDLIVNGTLIINGTFEMKSQSKLILGSTGVIIVSGDFKAANQVNITSGGIFIVQGNFTISGEAGKGSLIYSGDEDKAQVFIGGDVNAPNTDTNYPVLDEDTGSHESSNHNYGNITDLSNEQPDVWEEYKEIICGSGIDPGKIISQSNSFCDSGNPLVILEDPNFPSSDPVSYQWYYSTNSTDPNVPTWTAISGANNNTFDPNIITKTTTYYREAKKGNGCIANSNPVRIQINPKPKPIGIFF
ncbi:hypothetical protein [Marinifilum sp. D714]|uniref:Ig-like domain-containing protein n=1 Tax=Marinifilum sp. D714 TaxID=2937523 RepID=UPI0027C3E0CD|nr:hypothetical protein [Marinifilum sp. D714]MDQ2178534.1 hypothetical protein [Marinifilum sp. D714]